jgi:hypothetical protein
LNQTLGLPKVDVENAGMTALDLSPGDVCLLGEEYVSRFKLGHDIGVPSDFLMVETFPTDHLAHLNVVRLRALEADYCIPWCHIALQLIGYHASLHILSLRLRWLRGCVTPHIHRRSALTFPASIAYWVFKPRHESFHHG